jgi:hypothetical protein
VLQYFVVELQFIESPKVFSELIDNCAYPVFVFLECTELRAVAAISAMAMVRKGIQPGISLGFGRDCLESDDKGL